MGRALAACALATLGPVASARAMTDHIDPSSRMALSTKTVERGVTFIAENGFAAFAATPPLRKGSATPSTNAGHAGPDPRPDPPAGPDPGGALPDATGAGPAELTVHPKAADKGPILFGMAAPFSGPAKELGRQMRIGVEAAFGEADEAGGLDGRRLELVTADDGYEPARTTQAMRTLVDKDHVLGVIGNVGTATAEVSLPYALDHRILFYGALTGADLLRTVPPDRYVFNFRPSYAEETEAAVRYLLTIRDLKPREIAVFAQDDAFGDAGYDGVTKALRSIAHSNVKPLLLRYKRNSVDTDAAVEALSGARSPIKAVVMVATYRAAARFIEKVHDIHPSMVFTDVSFVGSTALADELTLVGPRYADGVVVTQVVPDVAGHSKLVLEYRAALERRFPGEAPDYLSLEGFVEAKVLIEAVGRAGADVDAERLVDALEGMRDLDVGLGAPVQFSAVEHQASHRIWGTRLDASGRYRPIELR